MLLETGQPTGPGRFTHHASPNILVMSMATSDSREADSATEPVVDTDTAEENYLTPIQPIVTGDVQETVRISEKLKQAGILVSAIRPPTVPENTARLRITLCADHNQQQIDQLLENLAK